MRPVRDDAKADLVVGNQGLTHEADLSKPLHRHAARVAPGGRLVLEFHHLLPLVEQSQIDTIRHGHWAYLSATALQKLLAPRGLRLTRAVSSASFGGSLRVTARWGAEDPEVDDSIPEVLAAERAAGVADAQSLGRLVGRGCERAEAMRHYLEALARSGRSVAGYGAPSKAPVLLALAGVDESLLPYTVDLSPAKHGCRIPGTGVPIHPVDLLLDRRPAVIVMLTWDIADEVVDQLGQMGIDWDPVIHVPMPEPHRLRLNARASGPGQSGDVAALPPHSSLRQDGPDVSAPADRPMAQPPWSGSLVR